MNTCHDPWNVKVDLNGAGSGAAPMANSMAQLVGAGGRSRWSEHLGEGDAVLW